MLPPEYVTSPAWVGEEAYRRGWPAPRRLSEEITVTTVIPIRPDAVPARSTAGLGELIRAYRLYLGLSQREMADRLGKARRDYQRIEKDQDRCPPGLITVIEALVDKFDEDVDVVLAEATLNGGADLTYTEDQEWERNVAGRAAVLCVVSDIHLNMTERTS